MISGVANNISGAPPACTEGALTNHDIDPGKTRGTEGRIFTFPILICVEDRITGPKGCRQFYRAFRQSQWTCVSSKWGQCSLTRGYHHLRYADSQIFRRPYYLVQNEAVHFKLVDEQWLVDLPLSECGHTISSCTQNLD